MATRRFQKKTAMTPSIFFCFEYLRPDRTDIRRSRPAITRNILCSRHRYQYHEFWIEVTGKAILFLNSKIHGNICVLYFWTKVNNATKKTSSPILLTKILLNCLQCPFKMYQDHFRTLSKSFSTDRNYLHSVAKVHHNAGCEVGPFAVTPVHSWAVKRSRRQWG